LLLPDEPLPELKAEGALGVFGFSAVARRGIEDVLEKVWAASQVVVAEERGTDSDKEWWTP
jgi:hypothetical protein